MRMRCCKHTRALSNNFFLLVEVESSVRKALLATMGKALLCLHLLMVWFCLQISLVENAGCMYWDNCTGEESVKMCVCYLIKLQ